MRIGVLLPTRAIVMHSARRPAVDECWEMARHCDRAGYDAVWVGDSVVAKPRLEPLTTLAYVAAMTERVRLGTAVLLPALRQPVVLAHQIANLDQISRGRVVLGLGVGWSLPVRRARVGGLRHGPPAPGAPARGARRGLAGALARRAGERRGHGVALDGHTIGPLPWTAGGPPVLITAGNRGELLPAQFDRFARLGDGIITTYVDPAECRVVRERADEALARHGRALPGFPLCVYTTVRLDDDAARAKRATMEFLAAYYGGGVHQRGTMGLGPAAAVISALLGYAEASVTDLCVRFIGDDQRAQLERFTEEVLPALRT